MDWNLAVSSGLIILGAALMLVNIVSHLYVFRTPYTQKSKQKRFTKILIKTHLVFMVFFFIGYLAVLYFFINEITITSSLFVALIFFFGAVFVFLGIILQKRMFTKLQARNITLIEYNDRLIREQNRLLALNEQLQIEVSDRIKAQKADQLKSDFLSLVSHELRTPLTSIFGFTKLIEKNVLTLNPSEEVPAFITKKDRITSNLCIISDECCRLTRLINNVLDLAKIESGRIAWDDQPISLESLINSSLSALKGLLSENPDVHFKLNIEQELPVICIDADLFTQVLVNLISNAVKFTEKGTVSLSVKIQNELIIIVVKDEGKGIATDDLSNIFDKFYIVRSGDTLGDKKLGTGLGLPICKQIIEHYHGDIWAESDGNSWSSFHITLPNLIVQKC